MNLIHALKLVCLTLSSAFYFNFKSSIFGKLELSLSSGSRTVPHKYFLATWLLPCGKADGKLKKFTGNIRKMTLRLIGLTCLITADFWAWTLFCLIWAYDGPFV